jgi:hypothetical protein
MNQRTKNRLVLIAEITLVVVIVGLILATWLPAILGRG